MSTYVGKFLLTGEQKSAAKMYLCRYIGIIYTVCHPTHFKTHVYVHMYNTLQESPSLEAKLGKIVVAARMSDIKTEELPT